MKLKSENEVCVCGSRNFTVLKTTEGVSRCECNKCNFRFDLLESEIDFTLHSEGEGKREHTYPRFELLEKCMLKRVAEVMTSGAEKYGEYNWRNFNPEQVKDIPRHAFMHMIQYMEGDKTEDHLANCICNCMMMMWYEENENIR